jgi:hypothetical protein
MNAHNKLECLSLPQPSLMFLGTEETYLSVKQLKGCLIWVSSGLLYKHYTRLEMLARDKHSSLLRKFVIYDCKWFYNIGAKRQCYKKFVRNLLIFVLSLNVC